MSIDLANKPVRDIVKVICDLSHFYEISGCGADWADLCRQKIVDVLPVNAAMVGIIRLYYFKKCKIKYY